MKPEDLARPTEENIEGPFYRAGAPVRNRLCDSDEKGDRLLVSGLVVGPDGRAIAGAVLDVWHASAFGRYDNDDPDRPPENDVFHLRGRVVAGDRGDYTFETVRPGHYKITPTVYRPAHIHFKVSAPGYRSLTSQFFFKGEKHNKLDPWFKPSMVLALEPHGNLLVATFKIVLGQA
jgi:protocatechuate 3,4-dioxygenase beta subunit